MNSIEKQALAFARVNFYRVTSNEDLVQKMDQVSRARKWRGAVAKKFRLAVMEALGVVRAERSAVRR